MSVSAAWWPGGEETWELLPSSPSSHNWPEPEPGAGEESLSPVAWLRWVYTGSDIGPQPHPTHVTVTSGSEARVLGDTCAITSRDTWLTEAQPEDRGTGGGCGINSPSVLRLRCSLLTRLLTHSQCQGPPRPPRPRPRSPVPSLSRSLAKLSNIWWSCSSLYSITPFTLNVLNSSGNLIITLIFVPIYLSFVSKQ